jgi:hypothetical protein
MAARQRTAVVEGELQPKLQPSGLKITCCGPNNSTVVTGEKGTRPGSRSELKL